MLSSAGSDGIPRRARGALESAVMDVLWHAAGPLNPGEVRDLLAKSDDAAERDLSYSTVVTILTRLHAKKMLVRTRVGRSFQYAPLADEAGLAARRLTALLDGSADREAVLSRFVADLPDRDEEILRRLLGPAHAHPSAVAADAGSERGDLLGSAYPHPAASPEGGEAP